MNNYIWLFGENLGKTANNNSYYFWKQIVKKDDGIKKYIILEKNVKNKKIYNSFDNIEKKHVIWKNSYKHIKYYQNADMLFVSLSYLDVKPERFIRKYKRNGVSAPVVYLQHGTTGMKKLGYKGNSYWNNMFRFVYYNPNMKDIFIKENNFKEYQLKYGKYHPRYIELIKRYDKYKEKKESEKVKSILWFITWREYFGENEETQKFLHQIEKTITNSDLKHFLETNNYKLKICLHQFFDKEKTKILIKQIGNLPIEIVTPNEVDVMDEIVENDVLITDYSSLSFDFAFLNKKVILYQPDIKTYSKYREFYNKEQIRKVAVTQIEDLVKNLDNKNTSNEFLQSTLPEKIDYEYVRKGQHITDLYNYFYNIQKNDITFIGYNFYGKGGSVSATKSLAEGLLYKGKLVKFISLKRHIKIKKGDFPYGLNVKSFYYSAGNSWRKTMKEKIYHNRKNQLFMYDPNSEYLIPYIEISLKRKLNKIHSNTVVTTRESLHFYLYNAKSKFIKNKIYFFHTDCKVLEDLFKGLIEQLKKINLEKVIFVTNNSREKYKQILGYDQYKESTIVPNCIEEKHIIKKNEIKPINKSKNINAIYLLRISKDRIDDLNNLISFVEYLKEKNDQNIKIDVYGKGDYIEEFKKELEKKNLRDYISYMGVTSDIKETFKNYDCMIDFSLNHSFGMTYIEAILNGKMLFAMKNSGSLEVLNGIPECYINSFDDLYDKLNNLDKITKDDLIRHYDYINNRYSQKIVSQEFINFIEKE